MFKSIAFRFLRGVGAAGIGAFFGRFCGRIGLPPGACESLLAGAILALDKGIRSALKMKNDGT